MLLKPEFAAQRFLELADAFRKDNDRHGEAKMLAEYLKAVLATDKHDVKEHNSIHKKQLVSIAYAMREVIARRLRDVLPVGTCEDTCLLIEQDILGVFAAAKSTTRQQQALLQNRIE